MFTSYYEQSPERSEYMSPSRERSTCASSPTNSIASTCRTSSSVASTGVRTRQIRDLKMELEFRDSRIHELEEAYEELERKSEFAKGEMECRLVEQHNEVEQMQKRQAELDQVVVAQSKQLQDVMQTLEQYRSMQDVMATLMQRCQELEKQKKEQEEALRQEKLQAEAEALRLAAEKARIAEEAAAAHRLLEEQERKQREEEQRRQEEERRQREEHEAALIVAAQVARQKELALVAAEPQPTKHTAPASSATRPSPLNRFRPNTAPTARNGSNTQKKDCAMM